MHRDQLARLFMAAAHNGGVRTGLNRMEWEVHGDCTRPVSVEHFARKDRPRNHRSNAWSKGDPGVLILNMTVRCRQCPECGKWRGRMWYQRARAETFYASRTWFGTLTVAPEHRFNAELRARVLASRRAVEWGLLTRESRNRLTDAVLSEDVQKYWKRLRKEGAAFRYLTVAEEHKDGALHYHCLFHEKIGHPATTKRTLERQWLLGHSSFRLVTDPRAVGYVCKYISKGMVARVRASIAYGSGKSPDRHSEPSGRVDDVMTPPRDDWGGVRGTSEAACPVFVGRGARRNMVEQARAVRAFYRVGGLHYGRF